MSPPYRPVAMSALNVAPLVARLLQPRRPAAVRFFIVPIVVNPFDTQSGWTFAHVGEEVRELQPMLTNGDSACAVPFKGRFARVVASPQHARPAIVGVGRSTKQSVSVSC